MLPNRRATLDDNLWSDTFGLPSADGLLLCAIRFQGNLIAGGSFHQIGGIAANNIALWNGTSWDPLGSGLDGTVTSMVVYQGALYVGGAFQFVNGQITRYVARWDGSTWSPVGTLPGAYFCCHQVNSLAVYRGELVAGGDLGDPRLTNGIRGIARWDGTTWRTLGEGVNGVVRTMHVLAESLYVGGAFDSAGVVAAKNVAKWDGTMWSALGEGASREFWKQGVTAMTDFHGRLFAGGDFDSVGGQEIHGVAAWDGNAWDGLEGFDAGWVFGLAVQQDTLVVASYPFVTRWDGTAWTTPLAGIIGDTSMLLSDPGGVIAVGNMQVGGLWYGPVTSLGIAHWEGNHWAGYEPWNDRMKGLAAFWGGPAQVSSLVSYKGDLLAAGLITFAGTGSGWQSLNDLARWDGSNWTGMPSWDGSGIPKKLWVEADTLYVGGQFFINNPVGGHTRAPVLRLDFDHWTALDTMAISGSCFARYDGRLVAGMARHSSNQDTGAEGVYSWNGTHWDVMGLTSGVDLFAGIHSLTVHKGLLVAGGSFTSIGGTSASGIAAWDGSTWRPLGRSGPSYGYRPYVADLTTYDERLMAAGKFYASGQPVPVLVLQDSIWTPLDGLSGEGYAMTVVRGRLIVGGKLQLTATHEDLAVAMWDGAKWVSLGSGTNGPATAFLFHDDALYLGGYFSTAGGKSSFGIARWDGEYDAAPPAPPLPTPTLSPGHPNPFPAGTDFSLGMDQDRSVRITVYDTNGREVRVLHEGTLSAGIHPVRWDGRDRAGRLVPSGIYFVAIRDPKGVFASRKVVSLR